MRFFLNSLSTNPSSIRFASSVVFKTYRAKEHVITKSAILSDFQRQIS